MTYRAPVADIAFALKHAAGLKAALAEGLYGDLDEETVDSVLDEAGRFATDVIAPLNRVGDKFGTPFKDGAVTTPPGWKEAYTAWAAAGWNGLAAPGAMGRPGAAARGERRLRRDVEFGLDGLRHRPGADHGGGRCARRLRQRRSQSNAISASSSAANGWAPCSSPSRRPAPTSARCAPRPSAPATAAIASPARRSSSPMASTTSPTTSSISCWRGCPMRRPAPRASRCF